MGDERELVLIDRWEDMEAVCRLKGGFSDVALPSGLKIPQAPDGKAYYSTYRGLFHWLELRDREEAREDE